MAFDSQLVAPTGLSKGEMGFSLSEQARFNFDVLYKRLARHQIELFEEKVKFNGFVKIRTALECLNDLYFFVGEAEVKNELYYKRKELEAFKKFLFFYFEPQVSVLMRQKQAGQSLVVVGGGGFSIFHYVRWKKLCRFFMEVSGIYKFERPKATSAENAFGLDL